MVKTIRGRIHGKTVELNEDFGVCDGEQVEITIRTLPQPTNWGEGLLRCAGAMAPHWNEEDDRILDEIHQDRKQDTRREIPE